MSPQSETRSGRNSPPAEPPPALVEFAARFWSRVERTPGCWIWIGARDAQGRGRFSINGTSMLARRVALALALGRPLRVGRVRSRCQTPACVRPAHAWLDVSRVPGMVGVCARGHPTQGPCVACRRAKAKARYWQRKAG